MAKTPIRKPPRKPLEHSIFFLYSSLFLSFVPDEVYNDEHDQVVFECFPGLFESNTGEKSTGVQWNEDFS